MRKKYIGRFDSRSLRPQTDKEGKRDLEQGFHTQLRKRLHPKKYQNVG